MATAPQPPSSSHSSVGKAATSIGLVVALIGVIIFIAWLLHRLRPPIPAGTYMRHLRMRDTQPQKGIESYILDFIPIVKYTTKGLQPSEQATIAGANQSLQYSIPSRRAVRLKHGTLASIEEEREDTSLKNPGVFSSIHKILPEVHATTTRSQFATSEEPTSCPICTEEFREGENVRVLPCSHIFHRRCIDSWLLGFAGTCPLCRENLHNVVSSPTPALRQPQPVLLSSESVNRLHQSVPLQPLQMFLPHINNRYYHSPPF